MMDGRIVILGVGQVGREPSTWSIRLKAQRPRSFAKTPEQIGNVSAETGFPIPLAVADRRLPTAGDLPLQGVADRRG